MDTERRGMLTALNLFSPIVGLFACLPFVDGLQMFIWSSHYSVNFTIFLLDNFAWTLMLYLFFRYIFCQKKAGFKVAGMELYQFVLVACILRFSAIFVMVRFFCFLSYREYQRLG